MCVRYHVEVNVNLEVEAVKDNQICESENKVQKPLPPPWGLRGGCYPWMPVAFTRRERRSEGAKV